MGKGQSLREKGMSINYTLMPVHSQGEDSLRGPEG